MLPSGYIESRNTFCALATKLGAELQVYSHDDGAASGLFTDIARFGPADAGTIVVIASGTHGVEGYAGAACQQRFMQTFNKHYANTGMAYLLVHAVNPWGFLNDRRVTQEGIDLNRNFVDFPVAKQGASGYGAYHPLLVSNYRPMPLGLWNEVRLLSGALRRESRQSMRAAITSGQYDYPDGLFFGGQGASKSRVVWERIVNTFVGQRKRAFLLDIHSGLGKYGYGELISYLAESSGDFRRMSAWFDGGLKSMVDGSSVSAAVDGTLTAAFDRAVSGESYAIGLEFGTRPALTVLNAMRADQWYHNNAANLSGKDRERVRRKMKHAFAPADVGWHDLIIDRFDQVMGQVVGGLAAS
jgi:hypothetical protein